ncbi:plasmid stabilization system protein [archaeon BMS3Abin17]|nr:plasmid stabilization system protein [archaeon BMS3Abin17]HDZ60734.1 type II toxin-antitoxin system RelE/ParE family toxin [Candidatus Pacearchaeota archaeon]
MYNIEIRKDVEKVLKKLAKKDKISSVYISKKIKEIRETPYHFKPLKKPLQNFWRVHIGHYVLIYSINEKTKTIIIEKYKHHDEVYKV